MKSETNLMDKIVSFRKRRTKHIIIGIVGVLVFVFVLCAIFGLGISKVGLLWRFNNGDFPTPEPTIISWRDALEILYSGQVIKISQSHNLDVILMLKNGRVIQTKEPYIDEIFNEMKKCGKICSKNIISIATE